MRNMIDVVTMIDLTSGELHGTKRILKSDKIFQEHYPGQNIYPGVNTIQSVVCCCSMLQALIGSGGNDLRVSLVEEIKQLMGMHKTDSKVIVKVRLRAPIQGDSTVHYQIRSQGGGYNCLVEVGNRCVADGTIVFR